MKDVHFESSSLWQRTLGSNREGDKFERERLRLSYLSARNNATILLNELSHSTPHFTVHDISHVDALWETASMLCGSSVTLTPAEAYVLGCAFILHDAAMGAAAYQDSIAATLGTSRWHDLLTSFIVAKTGNWPTPEELASPDEEVAKSCETYAIRELHAAQAAKLVEQSWRTSACNELYLIDDVQLREWYGPLIGDLAASHWWSVDRLESHFRRAKGSLPWQPTDWIVDPLKLACILRLADATQIDSRRAPTFLFALRRPEGNSRQHWRFQEHVARPQLIGDRVTYTAWRPFDMHDADAWWLALDYLRGVDDQLKKVDALLHDLNKPRFEGRAVAGVDTPERFAELFQVRGWRPVDARVNISDIPHLVETLGGEQLYGKEPEVALRELLQNAQDAVMARKSLDPSFTDDEIAVTLVEHGETWTLQVVDRGVGMDEEILATALLDFGRTGWTSDAARTKFIGLADGGFRPKGRFGIGFFSVFMLGDNIEVVTRRFDAAPGDARRLRFRGVRERAILTPIPADERTPIGTRVRAELKVSPYDAKGIFQRTRDDRLSELIQHLCPENVVPVCAIEPAQDEKTTFPPVDLSSATAGQVFDILYPPGKDGGPIREAQRQQVRQEFERRSTELISEDGIRIGLAVVSEDLYYLGDGDVAGAVLVNGFRADKHPYFAGYIEGIPSRASRDQVEIAVNAKVLRSWLASQESRMRELGIFDTHTQVNLGRLYYRANRMLADDYHIAVSDQGFLTVSDLPDWVAARNEIYLCQGWPLILWRRPPQVVHVSTMTPVELPAGWLYPGSGRVQDIFDDVLPSMSDQEYEWARLGRTNTWQKVWWRTSDSIEGLVLKLICQAWECEIGDLLAPVEQRGWNDFADIGYDHVGHVPVYRLERPTPRT